MHEILKFQDTQDLRIAGTADEPLFCVKDVCTILGLANYRDAVSRIDEDERVSVNVDTLGGKQAMTHITEAGLYELLMSCREFSAKPQIKEFKKWVTKEVLPTIRKTGSYVQEPEYFKLLQLKDLADREIARLKKELKSVLFERKRIDKLIAKHYAEHAERTANALKYCSIDQSLMEKVQEIGDSHTRLCYRQIQDLLGLDSLTREQKKIIRQVLLAKGFVQTTPRWIDHEYKMARTFQRNS